MVAKPSWTDEAVAILKKMMADGHSHSEMAREINKQCGTSFSRNAVIGKASRMGLKWSKPSAPKKAKVKAPPKPKKPVSRKPKKAKAELAQKPIINPAAPRKPQAPLVEDMSMAVSFDDLQHHQCRWPVSGKDASSYKFCGQKRSTGKSYCAAHIQRSQGIMNVAAFATSCPAPAGIPGEIWDRAMTAYERSTKPMFAAQIMKDHGFDVSHQKLSAIVLKHAREVTQVDARGFEC